MFFEARSDPILNITFFYDYRSKPNKNETVVIHLLFSPCLGFVYDTTNTYRISFYAAGAAMILNSTILLMNHIWIKMDERRLKTGPSSTESDSKKVKENITRGDNKADTADVQGLDGKHGISNPVMSLYFREEMKCGVDAFL